MMNGRMPTEEETRRMLLEIQPPQRWIDEQWDLDERKFCARGAGHTYGRSCLYSDDEGEYGPEGLVYSFTMQNNFCPHCGAPLYRNEESPSPESLLEPTYEPHGGPRMTRAAIEILADEVLSRRAWQNRDSNFQNLEWQKGVKELRDAIMGKFAGE